MRAATRLAIILAAALCACAGRAEAATCDNGANFGPWLAAFKAEAAAAGVSPRALAALDGVRYDPGVVRRDRGQGVFQQTFLEFAGRMVAAYRMQKGAQLIKKHAATFARIEQDFGVPPEVIVAFWGLETDFGAFMGDFPTLTAIATLAYDCRRPDHFRPQLLAALQIIDRGDLTAAEMKGAWAGELGQVQFMALDYLRSAVDYDGDGKRNLIKSTEDALGSAGAFLAGLGWQRGQPWLQEVRVPEVLPWEKADISIKLPRSEWARLGVTYPGGGALPADGLPASLVLPMGRMGPAFLAYPNFDVYLKWNQSLVYATTAAYFATRLGGAPVVGKGRGTVKPLSGAELKELQQLLAKRGFDVGKIDGLLGLQTRSAVRQVQLEFGLPADSYPSAEVLQRLRAGE